jgi:hypothetical protein
MRFAVNPQNNLRDREGMTEWKDSFTEALLVPTRRAVCLSGPRKIWQHDLEYTG